MCFPLHTHTILCFSDNVNIYFRFFIVLSSIYERCLVMYEIFEQLLQRYGVTAYKVSKETGITQSTLSDWKRGRSAPKTENMKKIADYFGVTIDYLTTGTENTVKHENPYEAKNDTERKLLMLCRKASDAPKEDREAILKNFESTIDMYLKAKGIKKE